MNPVLKCNNICFSYHSLKGETRALTNISFQVEKGEFLAIVGPSGCGNAMVLFWILSCNFLQISSDPACFFFLMQPPVLRRRHPFHLFECA